MFLIIYETRLFITTSTTVSHLSLSWAQQSNSIPLIMLLQEHFTNILPPMPGSMKPPRSFRCYHLNPLCTFLLPHNCHIPSPSYPPWFEHLHNIWWTVQITKLFTNHFSPVFCYFLLLGPTVFLSLCSSNSVRDQVSHPLLWRVAECLWTSQRVLCSMEAEKW
jgi:hypothetical protein